MDTRAKIAGIMKFYQDTQRTGLKDIEKQLTIFTDNCVFITFANAGVMGRSGILVFKNKAEIREAFQQYNHHIGNPDNVHIGYYDEVIDVENRRCNFNMHIQVKLNPKQPRIFFNILQLHLDTQFKIFKAYNWQGDTGQVTLEDIIRRT